MDMQGGEHLLEIFFKEKKRNLSQHDKVCQDCYVSRLEGLTLQQYVNIIKFVCEKQHKGMAKVASYILKHSFISLKDAFALHLQESLYFSSCSQKVTAYATGSHRSRQNESW